MSGLVSIVIPTFNRLDLTEQCLATLEAQTPRDAYELIVVDNASSDGTPEFLREQERADRLRAILNAENVGFGRACNSGAEAARGELVLFLNNDTLVRPGWLQAMVSCMEANPDVGVVGSRLVYGDGTIQHAGIALDDRSMPIHVHRHADANAPDVMEARDCPAVTGACLLVRAALYEQLGGFSEEYRMYVEDVDLCFGVWAAGYRVRYCPDSLVVHLENASVTDVAWRDERVLDGLSTLRRRWAGRLPAAIAPACGPAFAPVRAGERLTGLAFAEELLARPGLLESYGRVFDESDDATLLIAHAPGSLDALADLVESVGMDGTGTADLLAIEASPEALEQVARARFALTSARPPGPFAMLPRYDERTVSDLRALLAA